MGDRPAGMLQAKQSKLLLRLLAMLRLWGLRIPVKIVRDNNPMGMLQGSPKLNALILLRLLLSKSTTSASAGNAATAMYGESE